MELLLIGNWFSRVVGGGVRETLVQLVCLVLPLFLFALLLAILARISQTRLAHRFGWRSVLATGWLGAPIHEMSHVLLCIVFGHSIEEVAFFKPDRQSGRLGYVKHGYRSGNYFQATGNFFIGLAPLAGGALVLYGLLWFFYPGAAAAASSADSIGRTFAAGHYVESLRQFGEHGLSVMQRIVSWENLTDWRMWLFLYLALCIGSHLAPSRSDYRGATWGGVLLLGVAVVLNVALLALSFEHGWLTGVLLPAAAAALSLLALTVVLCSCTTLLVLALTWVWDLLFGRKVEQVKD